MACFPLVPYANRIAAACFRWGGQRHPLQRNFGDHPHSLHGVGWRRAWTVRAAHENAAILTLTHDEPGADWPFAFEAEQHFMLDRDRLRIALRVVNRHSGPAPVGLGWHPFFPRTAKASLRFRAASVWRTDATALAVEQGPIPPGWDHAGGQPVGTRALDHCFSDWDGTAMLNLGALRLHLQADAIFSHLQVFTPPGQSFFCVEPVTHRPDAINDPTGSGMRSLQPGEALEGTMSMQIAEA